MSGPRLRALTAQFDEVKTSIDTINDRATTEKRDLNPEEQVDYDKLLDRAEQLKPEITKAEQAEASLAEVAEITRRVNAATVINRAAPAATATEAPALTAGEYFAEVMRTFGANGGDGNIDRFMDRAALYFDRANQATTDNVGVLPTPIVGELIKLVDASRPAFASFTSRPMPTAGKQFTRPRVTQRVTVGEQLVEFDPLASQKMTIVGDSVTKRTFGGQLSISEQDVDWTDPAMLAIVINDFADEYAIQTEGAAKAFFATLPDTFSPWTPTTAQTMVTSIINGITAVYNQSSRYADTVWLGLDEWTTLATTFSANSDLTAIALLRQSLADSNLPQLRFVVVPGTFATETLTPDNDMILGTSSLVESYEQQKGLLRLQNPGTLSQTIATFGYVAFYGRSEGFVHLGDAV